jgi:hypothetical protein
MYMFAGDETFVEVYVKDKHGNACVGHVVVFVFGKPVKVEEQQHGSYRAPFVVPECQSKVSLL